MNLGAFSVSLAVSDLAASQAFYSKLGFTPCGGDASQGWLVMQNGGARIGLFQGMFEGNILTFNPGWDAGRNKLEHFEDVRAIQKRLRTDGIELIETADEATSGPAYITLKDPDGNAILIDQHV